MGSGGGRRRRAAAAAAAAGTASVARRRKAVRCAVRHTSQGPKGCMAQASQGAGSSKRAFADSSPPSLTLAQTVADEPKKGSSRKADGTAACGEHAGPAGF